MSGFAGHLGFEENAVFVGRDWLVLGIEPDPLVALKALWPAVPYKVVMWYPPPPQIKGVPFFFHKDKKAPDRWTFAECGLELNACTSEHGID